MVAAEPREAWRDGMTKARLEAELRERLEAEVAGVAFAGGQVLEPI